MRAWIFGVASAVTIATFDGAKATTWPWEPVNDPVMGGESTSTFKVEGGRGVWEGEVKIVPFLKAPGFCNLQAPGLYKTASFPDLSRTTGFVARAAETASGRSLTKFRIMLGTQGAVHWFKHGQYAADFVLNATMADHFLPWSAFACTWRGESVSWCPPLESQLAEINTISFGTTFPGEAGPFRVEIESLAARDTLASDDPVDLASFGVSPNHQWQSENDPVMGGQSDSTFTIHDGLGEFSGTCRIVPKLKAPGFTIALTESPWRFARFPDVSHMQGLTVDATNMGEIEDFKVAFCDSRINVFRCQFQSFKADFHIPRGERKQVFVPWASFSDKWDAATGKHTAESPPSASSLSAITQLQVWVEGVEGSFRLQLHTVQATSTVAQRAGIAAQTNLLI
jgi:hypothetical protein